MYSFFNPSAMSEWVVNATPRPLYPRERDTVPILQEAGWIPGLVWTGVENLSPTGFRSPDRPVRSSRYIGVPEHKRRIYGWSENKFKMLVFWVLYFHL
jgi:hypothetical protein